MRGQIARKIDVEDHDGDDVAIVDRSRHCLGGVQPDETTDVRASRRAVDHLAAPGPEILVVDAQIDVLDLERGAFIAIGRLPRVGIEVATYVGDCAAVELFKA